MNRQQYIQEYERIQRKYRKKFFPAVYKAINSIVSSLIDKIQTDGVNSAMGDLMLTIINDKIGEPVNLIYKEVGLFHVKNNYRFIRAEIGRKALGRNEIWVQEIIAYLEKNLWQYVVAKPTETLRDHFLRVLQEGIDKEWSVDDIIREIRSDQFARYQAERIVRTEVGRAANTGKKIAADSFPYEMQKEWISFQDMRTRGRVPDDKKDHYHLNGQTVAMDGMFTDPRSGEQIEYPNAPGGSPGMVINCRCTFATVPKRDEAGKLIERGKLPTKPVDLPNAPTSDNHFDEVFTPKGVDVSKMVLSDLGEKHQNGSHAGNLRRAKIAYEGLSKAGYEVESVSPSTTNYGSSLYLNLKSNGEDKIKVRISDHSVTNIDRIRNEYHVNKEGKLNKGDYMYLDRMKNPGKYVKQEREVVTLLSVPKNQLTENDTVLRERIAKNSGKTVYDIERRTVYTSWKLKEGEIDDKYVW